MTLLHRYGMLKFDLLASSEGQIHPSDPFGLQLIYFLSRRIGPVFKLK